MTLGKTLKKFAPHLIIMATLIAVAVPTLGRHALNELSPYLALSEELARPEAIEANIEIVSRTYIDDNPSKGWETVTWLFNLKVTNRGDETIIFPANNVTLHYLDETLGVGWINHKYEIPAGKSKIVKLYIVMENDRITYTWWNALAHGIGQDLTAKFEPYILIDGPTGEPFLGLNMVQEFEFPFPAVKRGPAPFIHSITRASVSANQPVSVSVSASDEGTGISNRTYIYYSINNGITWNQIIMTGGEWWDRYNYYVDENGLPHGLLGGYYPIRSTLQEETYEGEIPGFPSGTNILFKVYLEDYAGNYEHKKTANWVESQTYSYTVPGAGALPEFSAEFTKITEPSSRDKLADWRRLNGFHQINYLYLNGINSLTIPPKLPRISEFFYDHDIDASYAMGMMNIDSDKGAEIMSDSGIADGYMLDLFNVSIDDFFDYMVEHIFLPTKHDLAQQARIKMDKTVFIDDIEPGGGEIWVSTPPAVVEQNDDITQPAKIMNIGKDRAGNYRLRWNTTGPATLGRSFGNPIDLSKCDFLTFMLDYTPAHYQRLNGNLSVILTDNNGRTMTSNQITFEQDGGILSQYRPDQQITLGLNSREFTIDPGFSFGTITEMNFTYGGTLPVQVWFDYIKAYTSDGYNLHQYFTYDFELTNLKLQNFIFGRIGFYDWGVFWGIGASLGLQSPKEDIIITDWNINNDRLGGWNFLNLMATDNGTIALELGELGELGDINHHLTAANLFLEDRVKFVKIYAKDGTWTRNFDVVLKPRSTLNFFEKLCSLVDTEIDEFDKEPVKAKDIYPYTHAVAVSMVYIPLGAVAALATVLNVRRYRIRKKMQKIRTKYTKKLKR